MKYRVSHPTKVLKGEITLTASKSESNRALIIQAICEDDFEIQNLAAAEDTRVLKAILERVKANTSTEEQTYDVGAAGTTMRFLTAYLSTVSGTHILTGTDRMKNRPIGILVDALRDLGAEINYVEKEGYPPLKIEGKGIEGGEIEIDGNVSSQYISALLLVSSKFKKGLTLKFKGEVTSVPYINMTLRMMKGFFLDGKWSGDNIVVDAIENSNNIGRRGLMANTGLNGFEVSGDWSSASYWLAMVALSKESNLTIRGIDSHEVSLQGDSSVVNIFSELGLEAVRVDRGYRLSKSNKHSEFLDYDFSDCPDLAQTIATTVSALNIPAKFTGLHTLRIKETDRSLALQTELKKLGTDVKMFDDDTIVITPGRLVLAPAPIKAYEDHRMAMAFAPLALVCDYVDIEDPNVVIKSYPDFWKDLESVGFKIEEI